MQEGADACAYAQSMLAATSTLLGQPPPEQSLALTVSLSQSTKTSRTWMKLPEDSPFVHRVLIITTARWSQKLTLNSQVSIWPAQGLAAAGATRRAMKCEYSCALPEPHFLDRLKKVARPVSSVLATALRSANPCIMTSPVSAF